jgi:hypothetical protein
VPDIPQTLRGGYLRSIRVLCGREALSVVRG